MVWAWVHSDSEGAVAAAPVHSVAETDWPVRKLSGGSRLIALSSIWLYAPPCGGMVLGGDCQLWLPAPTGVFPSLLLLGADAIPGKVPFLAA